MLPQFQHLTKSQALVAILRQRSGSILHVDYIIRALHGDLAPDSVKSEKARMAKTLSEGALKGLWSKVRGEAGCYTFDLKLVAPDKADAANVQKQRDKRQKPQLKNKR